MALFWFSLFILLLFIEIFTVNLVTIWFALAALVCEFVAIWTDNIIIQIAVFLAVSIITLILTKPFLKKIKVRKVEATNLDRVIGKEAVVTRKITKDKMGEVKVLSMTWSAISNGNIDIDERVIVKKIDGAKLIVERKKEK